MTDMRLAFRGKPPLRLSQGLRLRYSENRSFDNFDVSTRYVQLNVSYTSANREHTSQCPLELLRLPQKIISAVSRDGACKETERRSEPGLW